MRRLLVILAVGRHRRRVAAGAPSWAQKGPIKVGMLVPQTGPLAANGKDMINGFELFFEEHKYRLAGREIKFIVEDDRGQAGHGHHQGARARRGPGRSPAHGAAERRRRLRGLALHRVEENPRDLSDRVRPTT